MIGRVLFAIGGRPLEAILDDDAQWSCSGSPVTEQLLVSCFPPDDGPAEVGIAALYAAAEFLESTVEIEPKDPLPDDAVF